MPSEAVKERSKARSRQSRKHVGLPLFRSLHAFPRGCAVFPFFLSFFFSSLIVLARAWRPKTSAENAPVISIKENKTVKNTAARVDEAGYAELLARLASSRRGNFLVKAPRR